MGPNKTISSISKMSKAVSGMKEILESYDQNLDIVSVNHTTSDHLKEEREMISNLIKLDPFTHMNGRSHISFPDIKRSPLLNLNILNFHKWLDQHKRELAS